MASEINESNENEKVEKPEKEIKEEDKKRDEKIIENENKLKNSNLESQDKRQKDETNESFQNKKEEKLAQKVKNSDLNEKVNEKKEESQEKEQKKDDKISKQEELKNSDLKQSEVKEKKELSKESEQEKLAQKIKGSDLNAKEDYEKNNLDKVEKLNDVISPHCQEAKRIAQNDKEGRFFTDHKEEHVEMVADKSLEAADAIKESIRKGGLGQNDVGENRVKLNDDIDQDTLYAAAKSHDMGMSNHGYALVPEVDEKGMQLKDENGYKVFKKDENENYILEKEDEHNFDQIRNNHSLNSAIDVLANRDKYLEAGYSDEQVDKIATECMAHSKSSSGVSDINSKEDWNDCVHRIDCAKEAYNKDHPESKISFNGKEIIEDNKKLGSIASETLALRLGDVSRNSNEGAESQSGENIYVDKTTINNKATSINGEIENVKIYTNIDNNPEMTDKSKQVHVGEQNIVDNHSFVDEEGTFTHSIKINDGTSAPYSTFEAIKEHIGELRSVKDENFNIKLEFDGDYNKEAYDNLRITFYSRNENSNVKIIYPWDNK